MKKLLAFLALLLFATPTFAQNTWTGTLGAGAKPAPSFGKEGDWFLDTTTYLVWGPKTSGVWPGSGIGYSIATSLPGQLPGTATNDNASAGNVGEYISASNGENSGNTSATVTITIASPAVVSWTLPNSYGFSGTSGCSVINFTTTGALPTGIVAGTNYYVIGSSFSSGAGTFQIATTCDNALAGTAINTSGTQSGTHTGVAAAILASGTSLTIAGITLPPGDWDVTTNLAFVSASSTSITRLSASVSTAADTRQTSTNQQTQIFTAAQVPGVASSVLTAGPYRVSAAVPTKIYGVDTGTFTVNTLTGWGGIRARRIR